jgi:hypothetical protein
MFGHGGVPLGLPCSNPMKFAVPADLKHCSGELIGLLGRTGNLRAAYWNCGANRRRNGPKSENTLLFSLHFTMSP